MICAGWCQRSFHANQAQSWPCITRIESWRMNPGRARDCWKIGTVLHLHTDKCVQWVLCPWAPSLWEKFCARRCYTTWGSNAWRVFTSSSPQPCKINFSRTNFNQSLEQVTLPSSHQSLSFGSDFNQSLESVALPFSLQSLSFGEKFNKSLERVTLPSSLQSLSLAMTSTKAWSEWPCHRVFRAWDWAAGLFRPKAGAGDSGKRWSFINGDVSLGCKLCTKTEIDI